MDPQSIKNCIQNWHWKCEILRFVIVFIIVFMNKMIRENMEEILEKMLDVIRKNPGIRPREIHEIFGLSHSWSLRKTLIKRGLVKKERKGNVSALWDAS